MRQVSKLKYFKKIFRRKEFIPIFLVILWVMVGYIIYPVSSLFIDSFRTAEGQFSLQKYLDFFNFQQYNYIVPFINSM